MVRLVNYSLFIGVILYFSILTHAIELIVDSINTKSAIACEDSIIELECAEDEFPKPISGYYGRYSIEACNPNFKLFPTGCVNSNITEIIETLCDKKNVCTILAHESIFGSPCGNSTHVLEINYICVKIPFNVTTEKVVPVTHVTKLFKFDEYVDFNKTETDIDYTITKDMNEIDYEIDDDMKIRNDYVIEDMLKNEPQIISLNGILNIMNLTKQTQETKEPNNFIKTANLLLNKTETWNELNKKDKSKSVTLLMDLLESEIFDTNLKLNKTTDSIQIDTENIVAEVKINKELKSELRFPTSNKINSKESVFLKIKEPKSDQKFLFMVYSNINEFISSNTKSPSEANNVDAENTKILNTNIISFKMNSDKNIEDLKEFPVELTFQHLSELGENQRPICSYWNYDRHTYEGEWKQDGCSIKKTNKTHTTCSCNHLTHFAVLMDIRGVYEIHTKQDNHNDILRLLTIVLSILSMICIILKLIVFNFLRIFKRSRETSRVNKDLSRITTHLCICLLLSLLVFLLGIFIKDLNVKNYCSLVAIASHYIFLCSFFWMLLQGVQLYLMLIKIFSLEKSPVSKFCLIAYGLPLIIVVISVIINYQFLNGKGYGTETHCWLSAYQNFNLSFIIPISLILIANILILVTVIHAMRKAVLSRKTYLNFNKKQEKFYKSLLVSGYLIMTLLGLPWIFGYFIGNTEYSHIFSYIFTIMNSSQGIIIFFMSCITTKCVREELYKYWCNSKFSLISATSSRSQQTNSQNNKNTSSGRQSSFKGEMQCKQRNCKDTKFFDQFLSCLKTKNTYELKRDGSNHANNLTSSSQHDAILRRQVSKNNDLLVPMLEDDSHTRLLIYEPVQNYLTYNSNQMKNPLHFHPYHREYHNNLPKRSSSHVSSNSSNSNRTHLTYVPPLVSTAETFVVSHGPFILRPTSTDSFKLRQASYQYYLIPHSSQQNDTMLHTNANFQNILLSQNLNDNCINYANQNLPQPLPPPPPHQNFKSFKPLPQQPISIINPEEHNYSLIENEIQTDLQYYCDEPPICSRAIEEDDDLNTNSYTEVPNQYDELDNMLDSSSSSSSSLSTISIPKTIQNNNNNNHSNKSNQISTPKNASVLSFNKK